MFSITVLYQGGSETDGVRIWNFLHLPEVLMRPTTGSALDCLYVCLCVFVFISTRSEMKVRLLFMDYS